MACYCNLNTTNRLYVIQAHQFIKNVRKMVPEVGISNNFKPIWHCRSRRIFAIEDIHFFALHSRCFQHKSKNRSLLFLSNCEQNVSCLAICSLFAPDSSKWQVHRSHLILLWRELKCFGILALQTTFFLLWGKDIIETLKGGKKRKREEKETFFNLHDSPSSGQR